MADLSWLPAAIFYPLTSLSDGCLLVAAALATTLGGRPLLWGASFAVAHLTYALVGAFAVSQLNSSSELVGDVLIVLGALVLLSHTLHHQLRHSPGGDCGCAQHSHSVSIRTMLSTAFGLSLHSMAGGAIARQLVGEGSAITIVVMIVVTSGVIGGLVGCVVQFGEWERAPLTKFFDKIPGLVSGSLILVAGWSLHHLLHHFVELSQLENYLFLGLVTTTAIGTAYFVHERISSRENLPIIKLSSRKA